MKTTVVVLAALAALTGCATQQPGYYASAPRVQDPYQWHTVSVSPSDRAGGTTTTYTEALPTPNSRVVYAEPAYTTTYVNPPVYYAPAPVYYAPAPSYYYPPVSIGLDFSFGRWCCGGRWGGRGYRHR
jgi:predicted small lipoprotein YifL